MGKKLLLGCGLPIVVVGLIVFYSVRTLMKSSPKAERSEVVSVGDVEIKVVETGTIEPLRKVEVKSKVGGRVSKLFVDEGVTVREGQVLATIDPQEINSQVAALRAQEKGSQARLAAAKKTAFYQQSQTSTGIDQYVQGVKAAEARLRQAEAEAKVQPDLTRQSIEIAQANLEASKSALKAQQESLNLMTQSTHPQAVVSAQSAYDQARAQADNAARNLTRQQQLLAKGFIAQQAMEAAETDASVAAAHLRDVKEHLDHIKQANELEESNARSQVASAQSQVRQMQSALDQARSSVLTVMKQREMDSARAAYAQAKSQLVSARSGRTQDAMRRDEIAASEAEVSQIQNQLKEVLVHQVDTTLVASMAGVITKRYLEAGELITSAISSFSSGTPVFQISDLATMLVKTNVNEVDIAKIKRGLLTEVTIDAARGVTFQARVRKVSPSALTAAVDPTGGGGNQSVIRFPVEIQIAHADPRLKPGMSARCAIIVARHRNVLRLPTNCVQIVGEKATVQVVTAATRDGRPEETTTARPVTVGLRGDDFIEIVSGLKKEEKVRPSPYNGPPRKEIDISPPRGNGP
jgi:HlyD family secretion protein